MKPTSPRPLLRYWKDRKVWTVQTKNKTPEDMTDEEYRLVFNELYLLDVQGDLEIEQVVYDWIGEDCPT